MAICAINIPEVGVGETGGHWRGVSVALLPCIWEADLQGTQAVLSSSSMVLLLTQAASCSSSFLMGTTWQALYLQLAIFLAFLGFFL